MRSGGGRGAAPPAPSTGPLSPARLGARQAIRSRLADRAEVRRSFESPQYRNQPLYQAAYLLGGLQLRGLRAELVDHKVMTNRQFHDEIMRQGNMPIALIRLAVDKTLKLSPDMDINWKFYGDLPEK